MRILHRRSVGFSGLFPYLKLFPFNLRAVGTQACQMFLLLALGLRSQKAALTSVVSVSLGITEFHQFPGPYADYKRQFFPKC